MMPVEQFVKVRSVALGQTGRMGDIALGCLQQLDEILLFKLPSGLGKRQYLLLVLLNGVIEQIFRNQ